MKNQYFGDVGDFGKYGLFRFLAGHGIKIAVNWYLTADDKSNDGKFTKYLQQETLRSYDEKLFELLKSMVDIQNPVRDVLAFEKKNAIPNAVYYHDFLTGEGSGRAERSLYRIKWHQSALKKCKDADLVFLDPDNGAIESKDFSSLRANTKSDIKYCFTEEIEDYYRNKKTVVYYCSKGRRTPAEWEKTKNLMLSKLPDARIFVLTFHKGTQRSYIFVLHEKNFDRYSEYLRQFLEKWHGVFTEDNGPVKSFEETNTDNKFQITGSDGAEVTIEDCRDGWVNIHFSD